MKNHCDSPRPEYRKFPKFKMLTAIQHVQLQINGFKKNLQVDVYKMGNVSTQQYKLFSLVSVAHKFCCLNN